MLMLSECPGSSAQKSSGTQWSEVHPGLGATPGLHPAPSERLAEKRHTGHKQALLIS